MSTVDIVLILIVVFSWVFVGFKLKSKKKRSWGKVKKSMENHQKKHDTSKWDHQA